MSKDFPAQERVRKLIEEQHFVVSGMQIFAGPVALTDSAVARAADVDRRIVKMYLRKLSA